MTAVYNFDRKILEILDIRGDSPLYTGENQSNERIHSADIKEKILKNMDMF